MITIGAEHTILDYMLEKFLKDVCHIIVDVNIRSIEFNYLCYPLWKFLFLISLPILTIIIIPKTKPIWLVTMAFAWGFILFVYIVDIGSKMAFFTTYSDYLITSKNNMFQMYTFFKVAPGFVVIYGIDMISYIFMLLTAFVFLCVFILTMQYYNEEYIKRLIILLFVLYFLLLNVFTCQNLFGFFFFFESTVIPMYFIVMIGGSRFQKTKASYMLVFFTVLGSLLMFISVCYLYYKFNTVNINILIKHMNKLSFMEQVLIWFSFFFSFAIKIPMYPFHTWLPEAHVEAPTFGSIILAGIILKIGIYGMIRILLTLLPGICEYLQLYVCTLAIISALYASILAIRQTDIKRIIAYASIAHMNIIVAGFFTLNHIGVYGAIFQSVSHGLVSTGLFIMVGYLYERYHTRSIMYFSGVTLTMPIFCTFFFLLTIANISFPLTSNFVGELLLFISIGKYNVIILYVSLISIIFNAMYSLWLFNRIVFGNTNIRKIQYYKDLDEVEILLLSCIVILVFIVGIYPFILEVIFPIHESFKLSIIIGKLI